MDFIIHAAGSLGNQADLGKKPYRLHCLVRVHERPSRDALTRAANQAAEVFIRDMAVQGWQHQPQYGFKLAFKGASVPYRDIDIGNKRPKRPPSAKEMLPGVAQGARFRSEDTPLAMAYPTLEESEYWDYDLSGVFLHTTILVEYPDAHEVKLGSRA